MTLDEFLEYERAELVKFGNAYRHLCIKNPQKSPDNMTHARWLSILYGYALDEEKNG